MNIKPDSPRYTPPGINWFLFFVGMAITWFTTHSGLGLLGCFVAALHISIPLQEDK